jgi:glycyl-tRNA synthetase
MSRYYLDDADVTTIRRLFEDNAAEARHMLDARLPVPAYYYVLTCSHSFNVLDARGAVSTTEGAKAFGRMRALAREVAQLWTARRAELGHPLGVSDPLPAAILSAQLSQVSPHPRRYSRSGLKSCRPLRYPAPLRRCARG